MAVEETDVFADERLSSQLRAWLDPHAAVSNDEQLVGGIADRIGGVSDWLPLILGAGFVIADAATTLTGHGDLVSVALRLTGH